MLDELDSTRRDNDFKELGTVPGPLQIYVLEGDDIPTLGDTLGTGVLIRGEIRQVIKPAGTNTDAGLKLFVEWGGDGDDEEIPLVVTTNPALEGKLRGEGTTVIDRHLIEAGGRLLRDEIGSCTKVWKRLMTAAVNHGMVTQEKEDEIIRSMMHPRSRPGSLRLLLSVLGVFVGNFGAVQPVPAGRGECPPAESINKPGGRETQGKQRPTGRRGARRGGACTGMRRAQRKRGGCCCEC